MASKAEYHNYEKNLPLKLDREILLQLSPEQLVDIIIEQAIATEKLNKRILELEQQVQKLRVSRDLDPSSAPPSVTTHSQRMIINRGRHNSTNVSGT